ncbi:hypothetical protein GCM10017620_20650 [Brevundimonas intermedia]|uniref:DUF4893 domain-containing protein n=1 Tax=Brevundimonas intermedia TaxID=74315 RepID=A0ABQ5TAB7_9CAUL|nr:DUF4893 domain-containing protein [Brevundimonas intermedia]GLK49092.1 hypothetical protein GCM10017620_20650 [Brevundimonas intermedia]
MRRTLLLAMAAATALSACGENSPNSAAEISPAVSEPAAGVPARAAPSARATPEQQAAAPVGGLQGGAADWRRVASAADASILGRLDQAWRLARAEAETAGFAQQVEALGPLVDPNAAQPGRLHPTPGTYRCRTIKLGRRTEGQGLAYVGYPWFACSVELTPGGDLVLTKTTGSQRTRGLLYPDTERRLVYIGAQAWGEAETAFPAYGDTRERDQVGVLERIGQNRWRLVIPWPKQEAKLELLEITR